MTPERGKCIPGLPFQSIENRGWEPRPVQLPPPRWAPPGPWIPDDEEAFMRGWMECERELDQRRIRAKWSKARRKRQQDRSFSRTFLLALSRSRGSKQPTTA